MYLVTLPQGHIRQGQNNIVVMNRPAAAEQPSTPVTPSDSPAKSNEHSATASPTSQTDRRNVAEILASLSGLMPEPPQNLEPKTTTSGGVTITPIGSAASIPTPTVTTVSETKPRTTAAILSSAPQTSSNRVVRVLQASKPSSGQAGGKASTTVVVTPAASASSGRSRKQVFVTAKSSPAVAENNSEKDTPAASANEEERDILEEDLNDLEYVPYPKTGVQPGRGRGRPPKSTTSKK